MSKTYLIYGDRAGVRLARAILAENGITEYYHGYDDNNGFIVVEIGLMSRCFKKIFSKFDEEIEEGAIIRIIEMK